MEDYEIVELYWARSQDAVRETERKYGTYCHTIAVQILDSREDAQEVVNDTWLGAWNSMPQNRPRVLKTYLGRITRNLALRRCRDDHRQKRGGGQLSLALEELEQCLPGGVSPEKRVEAQELGTAIDRFLGTLALVPRQVFLARYWFLDPIETIAKNRGFSVSKVKSILFRVRKALKAHLEKEELV